MTETIEYNTDSVLTEALELNYKLHLTMDNIFSGQLMFDKLADAGVLLQQLTDTVDVENDLSQEDKNMLAGALRVTMPELSETLLAGTESFAETLAEGIKNIFIGIYQTFITVVKRLLEAVNLIRAKGINGIRQASFNQGRSAIDMAKLIAEQTGDPRVYESKEKDIKAIFKTIHKDRMKKSTIDFFDDYRQIVNMRLELMEQLVGDGLAKHRQAEQDRLKNGTRLEALGNVDGLESIERVHERLDRELEDSIDRIKSLDNFVAALRKMSSHDDVPMLVGMMFDYGKIINSQIKQRQRDKYGWVITSNFGVNFTPHSREGDIYMVYPRVVKGEQRRQELRPISMIEYISFVRDEKRQTTAFLLDNSSGVGKTKVLSSAMKELNAESMTLRYVMMQDVAAQETSSEELKASIQLLQDFIKKVHIAGAEEMKFLIQLREFYISYNTAFLDYPVF